VSEQLLDRLADLVEHEEVRAIVKAIRGPDTGNASLKWIFTARIRHLALRGRTHLIGQVRPGSTVDFNDIASALVTAAPEDAHLLEWSKLALAHMRLMLPEHRRELKFLEGLADALMSAAMSGEARSDLEAVNLVELAVAKINSLLEEYAEYVG